MISHPNYLNTGVSPKFQSWLGTLAALDCFDGVFECCVRVFPILFAGYGYKFSLSKPQSFLVIFICYLLKYILVPKINLPQLPT